VSHSTRHVKYLFYLSYLCSSDEISYTVTHISVSSGETDLVQPEGGSKGWPCLILTSTSPCSIQLTRDGKTLIITEALEGHACVLFYLPCYNKITIILL